MDVRIGFKQTEAGTIPQDWDSKRLGDLFEVTSSKRVFQSDWKSDGIPFYRARELAVLGSSGSIDNDLFISREMYECFKTEYGVPALGDMLVTGVGTLGKTYVVANDQEFYFKDGNIIWFKIAESISSEFLRQLYLTPILIKQIEDGSAGTTVGTYTISGAKKTVVPFPPIPEQEAIAKALSDADALIESLERLISKKRQMKQGAMQDLLTGKRRLPGFKGGWIKKKLGESASIKARIGWQGLTTAEYLNAGDFLLVTGTDFRNGLVDWENCHYVDESRYSQDKYIQLKVHDVLVTKDGTIGKVALVSHLPFPATLNSGVFVVRPLENSFDSEFFYYLLCSRIFAEFLKELSAGSTINHLYQKDFVGFEYNLPETIGEQRAIAAILADMDLGISVIDERLSKARRIKLGMMQELLTGRIRLV